MSIFSRSPSELNDALRLRNLSISEQEKLLSAARAHLGHVLDYAQQRLIDLGTTHVSVHGSHFGNCPFNILICVG
jgi:hypothetical protein